MLHSILQKCEAVLRLHFAPSTYVDKAVSDFQLGYFSCYITSCFQLKKISQISLLDVTDIFSLQSPLATQSAKVNVSGYT